MTNSVEICKQLSSLNLISVKLKSNKFLNGNFLSVQFIENECKLYVKCSVAINSDVQCQDCFECQLGKLKLRIIKVSKLFSIWVGLFLNFRKIEPTVSYSLLLIRKCFYCMKSIYIFSLAIIRPALLRVCLYGENHSTFYRVT